MNEALHPAQLQAIEKLKRLKVGALYMERQEGKLQTVAELIHYRMERGKIDGVIWLCTRRRIPLLIQGIAHYLPEYQERIWLYGLETLSHNLHVFMELMGLAQDGRFMLVIDNGLLIKNIHALRTQRVIALSRRCPYRLLISDVPFALNAADMFAPWYILDWRILGYASYWTFCLNHLDAKKKSCQMDYLARCIEPYCAQIFREDVQLVGGRQEYVWRFRLTQEMMEEYRAVMNRFIWKAAYSTTGVYRLLQACQHAAGGRKILQDYPLMTAPFYADESRDPRLAAFLTVLEKFPGKRILVLCRYSYECELIERRLNGQYGNGSAARYPSHHFREETRFTVMSSYCDEREFVRLRADVIIYYSSDWNWRKRQEKEKQCQSALVDGVLTVVSLAAADTIDDQILRCIWSKDNGIQQMRRTLMEQTEQMSRGHEINAKDL